MLVLTDNPAISFLLLTTPWISALLMDVLLMFSSRASHPWKTEVYRTFHLLDVHSNGLQPRSTKNPALKATLASYK